MDCLQRSERRRTLIKNPPIGPSADRGFLLPASCRLPRGLPIHGVHPRHTIKRRPFFHFQDSPATIIYPAIHFFISSVCFSSSLPITYDSPIRFYLPTDFFTFSFSLSFLILILLSTIIYYISKLVIEEREGRRSQAANTHAPWPRPISPVGDWAILIDNDSYLTDC